MNCPRCNVPLKEASVRESSIVYSAHTCEKCDGYWMGPGQLDEVEDKIKQQFVEFRQIPSGKEQMEPLNCPTCPGPVVMDKVENDRDKKVIMDVCPTCKNIWLDGGELDAVQKDSLLALIVDTFRWGRNR